MTTKTTNYFALVKAVGTIAGTIGFFALLVLGSIHFPEILWGGIGILVITGLVLWGLIRWAKFLYRYYHPNWEDVYDVTTHRYNWVYNE